MPLCLPSIAIPRVIQTLRSGELEVHGLAGEWTKPRGDEEKPGQKLRSVFRRAEELPGLVGQISRIALKSKTRASLPPGPSVSTIAGTLPFGLISLKASKCCSPLLVSTGSISYGKPASSRKSATLAGLGVGMEIEADHLGCLSFMSEQMAFVVGRALPAF